MPFYVGWTKGDFEPCPAGLHVAVCCDIVDKGMMPTQWGEKHKVQIRWQADVVSKKTGKRFMVSKLYTVSLHEKSALRGDLEGWRGRGFKPAEIAKFDLESLIGVPCQLNVVQTQKGEETYANVKGIVPAPKGCDMKVSADYVRVKDQPVKKAAAMVAAHADTDDANGGDFGESTAGAGEDDDALPF